MDFISYHSFILSLSCTCFLSLFMCSYIPNILTQIGFWGIGSHENIRHIGGLSADNYPLNVRPSNDVATISSVFHMHDYLCTIGILISIFLSFIIPHNLLVTNISLLVLLWCDLFMCHFHVWPSQEWYWYLSASLLCWTTFLESPYLNLVWDLLGMSNI